MYTAVVAPLIYLQLLDLWGTPQQSHNTAPDCVRSSMQEYVEESFPDNLVDCPYDPAYYAISDVGNDVI